MTILIRYYIKEKALANSLQNPTKIDRKSAENGDRSARFLQPQHLGSTDTDRIIQIMQQVKNQGQRIRHVDGRLCENNCKDRQLITLFPENIDDYVTDDNPVGVVDAFVISLDIKSLGFLRAEHVSTGRPPYVSPYLLMSTIFSSLSFGVFIISPQPDNLLIFDTELAYN